MAGKKWMVLGVTLALAGCGGSGTPPAPPLPEGREVADGPFETYRTGHSNQNRVTHRPAPVAGDAAVLAGFDSAAGGPAGYAALMKSLESGYDSRDMVVEVIAEMTQDGRRAQRLLRLTADQAPLENVKNGRIVAPDGKFYFRGQNFAWVTIDNQPMLSGTHDQGLVDLVLDFGAGTASIDLRTNSFAPSEVEVNLTARDMPFNVVTGAYGGPVKVTVGTATGGRLTAIDGALRGSVGGSPTYSDGRHGLTTSGLYTATGTARPEAGGASVPVSVDGVWFGRDPNARP